MEEFHGLMQTIKDTMPEHVQGQRRNKYTTLQLELLTALETRLPFIEEEEKVFFRSDPHALLFL